MTQADAQARASRRAGPSQDEVVLLLGFPSFRAARILDVLLRDVEDGPRVRVHAVVHEKLASSAETLLATYTEAQRRSVKVLVGDAGAIDMGLSGAEFRALTAEVDVIHHAAQVSYPGVDRKTAEYVNVGAMREMLELAEATPRLKACVVHSSASVSGNRTGLVRESELDEGQRFRNVIDETLARAERMAREAMRRVPIIVLRPAFVVGDSRTGDAERLDGPYLLVLLMLAAPPEFVPPIPTRADARVHVVPVDWVAEAAVRLSRDPRAVGRTVHLCEENPPEVRAVLDLVARAGGRRAPRGFLPANLTKTLLRAPGLEKMLRSPRTFLDALATPVQYERTAAMELLADLPCPAFASYVEVLVAHVRKRIDERRASRDEGAPDPLF
ncbi:hypothetical protein BH09MYX1_BH09MYX1_10410 [soil metagenome]